MGGRDKELGGWEGGRGGESWRNGVDEKGDGVMS